MAAAVVTRAALEFAPLTAERWPGLVALFGARGACGGCWCMAWRLPRPSFEARKGDGNRRSLRQLVTSGPPPGILAYRAGEPIAWCAVAPRTEYVRLDASRVLAPVDARPVWSISCLFVRKSARRQGVLRRLLRAAAAFAHGEGASIVEGYPVEPGRVLPDPFVWTGLASAYRAAGFREVARRSPTRPIMRRSFRSARERVSSGERGEKRKASSRTRG
jgi:GNAT superfamily N-acetyltransferase